MFKFTLDQDQTKKLKNLASFAPKKATTIPTIHFSANSNNQFTVKVATETYDLIVTTIEVKSTEGTLPFNSFNLVSENIKNIPTAKKAQDCVISIDDNAETYTVNTGGTVLRGLVNTDDYPTHPHKKDAVVIGAVRNQCLKKLQQAAKSTATSESRPVLTTININKGTVYSTDSHRLYKTKIDGITNSGANVLLPTTLIKYVTKLEDSSNFFGVLKQINDEILVLETLNTEYYVRTQLGNYPDTSRLIPDTFSYEYEVNNVLDLIKTLKAAKKFTDKNDTLKICFEGGEMTIEVFNPVKGEFRSSHPVIPATTDAENQIFKISVISTYLATAMEQTMSNSVKLQFMGAMRPFLVTAEAMCKDTVALVLPVRTY